MIKKKIVEKYETKRTKIIQNLPFDCWSHILLFLSTHDDLFSLLLTVKGLMEYLRITPMNCRNIIFEKAGEGVRTYFNSKEMPIYFMNLRCNHRQIYCPIHAIGSVVLRDNLNPLDSNEKLDFLLNKFPGLTSLEFICVRERIMSLMGNFRRRKKELKDKMKSLKIDEQRPLRKFEILFNTGLKLRAPGLRYFRISFDKRERSANKNEIGLRDMRNLNTLVIENGIFTEETRILLASFTNLRELRLVHSKFEILKDPIFKHPKLKILKINCEINRSPFRSKGDKICFDFPELEYFRYCGVKFWIFDAFGDNFPTRTIKKLDTTINNFDERFRVFSECVNLEEFKIILGHFHSDILRPCFENMRSLRFLEIVRIFRFSSSFYRKVELDIRLNNLPKLEKLSISGKINRLVLNFIQNIKNFREFKLKGIDDLEINNVRSESTNNNNNNNEFQSIRIIDLQNVGLEAPRNTIKEFFFKCLGVETMTLLGCKNLVTNLSDQDHGNLFSTFKKLKFVCFDRILDKPEKKKIGIINHPSLEQIEYLTEAVNSIPFDIEDNPNLKILKICAPETELDSTKIKNNKVLETIEIVDFSGKGSFEIINLPSLKEVVGYVLNTNSNSTNNEGKWELTKLKAYQSFEIDEILMFGKESRNNFNNSKKIQFLPPDLYEKVKSYNYKSM